MVRGRRSRVGETRVAPNGYHYTRTKQGWELTHRILLRKKLGRDIESNERCRFIDGDKTNLDPDNLEVYVTKEQTAAKKRARLEAKIEELSAELQDLS